MTASPHPETPSLAAPAPFAPYGSRRQFYLRRTHSLMGLLFGGFITVHLITNATALSPRLYQQNIDRIHSLGPYLPAIEIITIFLPLLAHMLYGLYLARLGRKANLIKYNYAGSLRYWLQRWTAFFLLAFIAFHIATLHHWGLIGIHNLIDAIHAPPALLPTNAAGDIDTAKLDLTQRLSLWCENEGGLFNARNQAFQSTVSGVHYFAGNQPWSAGNLAVMAFYLLAIWCAVFHFANGLWTAAIAWSLTPTAASQRRWGHVCLTFGILLCLVGTTAWYAFTIAPAAQGDLLRWDDRTHTLPDLDEAPDAPPTTTP